jgi:multicomponent Na+:H+ antiporter subunit A
MVLPVAVASGFLLALLAPFLVGLDRRIALAAWLAAPMGLLALFIVLAPGVLGGEPVRFEADWVPQLGLSLTFSLDGLSLLFALLISGIGALVVLYAERYLGHHAQRGRFQAMLLAFMASMLGLVLSDDLLLVAVFWGLTGITSFLLIGFVHEVGTSRLSAQQALLVTVAGELAMLAGLVLLGFAAGTFTISALPADLGEGGLVAQGRYALIVLLVMAGAFSKSAQFPVHFWLPNAMAAPTPVSAYLHSATMVTAGVYLLARLAPTLGGTPLWTILLVVAGGITLLIGAALALRQHDLKLVLAYSTVAALGTMVLLLGLGTPTAAVAALALLLAHAIYKAGLFLVVGIIDHETGTRELDRLSGLGRLMPITAVAAALGALSMAGLPPLIGFAAKELGLKAALAAPDAGWLVVLVLVLGGLGSVAVAGLTSVVPFAGRTRTPREHLHDPALAMWLAPLALGAVGLAAGLLPGLGAGPLVVAAAEAVSGSTPSTGLAPWYGIDAALLLSLVSLALGALLVWRRTAVRGVLTRLDVGWHIGPEKAYVSLERRMLAAARWTTDRLQNGSLRFYLLVVVGTLVTLVWLAIARAGGDVALRVDGEVDIIGLAVAAIIVAGALAAARSRSRLGAVTALGVVGYGVALVYVLYSAPDLAMAQILVETLTVLLFVLVFYHMPRFGPDTGPATRLRDALVAAAGGTLLTLFILVATSTPDDPIGAFFSEAAQPLAKGRNVVNTIIVDFRALDTLGEVAVLGIAAFGVLALLKLRARRRGHAGEGE